jgi:pimeloyl-ACP methyl ester carboxylesterase
VLAGGLRMHVAERGDGPPLLLLHGWPQHWWMWRKVLPELAGTYRCIAPDLRGLGWTEAPPGGYAKDQLARDVVALMDALGLERARVIGHDWGALVALLLAAEAPERVERCIALSIPAPYERGYDPRQLVGFSHMPVLSAPGAERVVPWVAERVLRLSGLSREEAEPYVAVLRAPERRRATVGYYRTFLLREAPRFLRRRMARPKVPVLVAGGAHDPVCRWSRGVRLYPRAAHFLPEDRPDVVLELARTFL